MTILGKPVDPLTWILPPDDVGSYENTPLVPLTSRGVCGLVVPTPNLLFVTSIVTPLVEPK